MSKGVVRPGCLDTMKKEDDLTFGIEKKAKTIFTHALSVWLAKWLSLNFQSLWTDTN